MDVLNGRSLVWRSTSLSPSNWSDLETEWKEVGGGEGQKSFNREDFETRHRRGPNLALVQNIVAYN